MSEPRDPYDIEPEKPEEPAREAEKPAVERPPPGKAHLEGPRLLDHFEEDADFDRDPELERAITGKKDSSPKEVREEDEREEFAKGIGGQPLHWAIAGGVLLIAALIATGLNAPEKKFLQIAMALYNTLLHTGTGVVAVFIAAFLLHGRVKSPELAAARMFAAVAAFMLVFKLNINFFGPTYSHWGLEELILATAAYVAVVAVSFRLLAWIPLAYVIGSHFVLWLVVQVGMELAGAVGDAPSRPVPRPRPEPPAVVEPERPQVVPQPAAPAAP